MGLIGKLLGGQGSENTTLNKQDAFLAVLLITVAADGHISSEECESVVGVSNRMSLLKGMSAEQFNSSIRNLQGLQQKHGSGWLLSKAAEVMPSDLRQTAFAIAADLVFADGSIESDEESALEAIQSAMQVPDDLAAKIIEVLVIKNRG
jgi:tellurite resistance protein